MKSFHNYDAMLEFLNTLTDFQQERFRLAENNFAMVSIIYPVPMPVVEPKVWLLYVYERGQWWLESRWNSVEDAQHRGHQLPTITYYKIEAFTGDNHHAPQGL